jgi:hypothetical protein
MNIYDSLPKDIQDHIRDKHFLYPQSAELRKDIENFKIIKDKIIKKYEDKGLEYTDDVSDDFNIYAWIENDLLSYWNDNIPLDIKISKNNITRMERFTAYNIKKDKKILSDVVNNFHNNNTNIKIVKYIAGLNIYEREEFINIK